MTVSKLRWIKANRMFLLLWIGMVDHLHQLKNTFKRNFCSFMFLFYSRGTPILEAAVCVQKHSVGVEADEASGSRNFYRNTAKFLCGKELQWTSSLKDLLLSTFILIWIRYPVYTIQLRKSKYTRANLQLKSFLVQM